MSQAEKESREDIPRPGTRHRLDGARMDEEIYLAFPERGPGYGTDPADGMPRVVPLTPLELALAPDHHPDTFVCMADERAFCLRDRWGAVRARFRPAEVSRAPDGRWRVSLLRALWRAGVVGLVVVLRRWLASFGWFVEVDPIRPSCRYYGRQLADFEDDKDHRFLSRVCMRRRDDDGDFLSLRDTQLFACDLRTPADPVSLATIEQLDAELVRRAEVKRNETPFDLERALAERRTVVEHANDRPLPEPPGGIFRGKQS